MKQPCVSIIVPIYNTESYLRRCMDSLIHQTLKDIEIIMVDDGSKDTTSKQLIEAYNMHPVRRPIHKCIECQPVEFIYESYRYYRI